MLHSDSDFVLSLASPSSHRALTYFDNDDENADSFDASASDIVRITGYCLLVLSFSLIAYYMVRVVSNVPEFGEWRAIRIVLPAVACFLAVQCATLAVDESISIIPAFWAGILYTLQAFVAPGLFLSTFAVTFVAYRIRSMPFCCVRRRSHQEDETTGVTELVAEPLVQPRILVPAMNLFALALLTISLLVNFDAVWKDADLAGRTGWMAVILEPWEPSTVHVCLVLIPMTVICCFCLYFAGLLFRYGNELSMTIYTTFLNPWMWTLLGAVAMFAGQFPRHPWFALSSNMGICIYQVTILRVLFEIRQDLGQATELGIYLGACWEVPAGIGEATVVEVVDQTLAATDKSGILRPSTTVKKEEKVDGSKSLESTLL